MSSEVITRNDLKNVINSLLPIFYPVGSYYETSKTQAEFDPNIAWGGTWVLESEGMVHVSGSTAGTYNINGANSNNGAGVKDGGNKDAIVPYHKHSVAQFSTGGESSHTHSLSSHTHGTGHDTWNRFWIHKNTVMSRRQVGSGGTNRGYAWTTDSTTSMDAVGDKTATGGPSNNTSGAGTSHSHTVGAHDTNYTPSTDNRTNANMQPFIVINRWHRIA